MAIRLRALLRLGSPPPPSSLRVFLERNHPDLLSFRQAAKREGLTDTTVLVTDRKSASRFLRPGDFFDIEFTPFKGPATAFGRLVLDAAQIPGKVRPFPEDDDAALEEPGLKIQVRSPGGVVEAGDNVVRFDIAPSEAERIWTCRFRNVSQKKTVAFGQVTFPAGPLLASRIPIRLLNQAAAQLLSAVAPRIRLDASGVELSFAEELATVLGETNASMRLPVDGVAGILADLALGAIELDAVDVHAFHGDSDRFRVDVSVAFSGELSIGTVDELSLTTSFLFRGTSVHGRRTIDYTVDAHAKVDIDLDPVALALTIGPVAAAAAIAAVPLLENLLETTVATAVESRFEEAAIEQALGSYLSLGLVEIVRHGNAFHDLRVDGDTLIITHTGLPIVPPVPLPPLIAPDPQDDPAALANLSKIDHIIVLMMENRSFDHMLGYLTLLEGRTDVDGLTAAMSNSLPGGGATRVHQLASTVFPRSPVHGHSGVLRQIAEGKMSGFLKSFADDSPLQDPEPVMGFYNGEQLPTYHLFARTFVVCDRWFCAFPGATWPNRFCAISGRTPIKSNPEIATSEIGYVGLATIFDALSAAGVEWAYYENDVSFLRMVNQFRLDDRRVIPVSTKFSADDRDDGFFKRVKDGTLPPVTYIDPNFSDIPPHRTANDDLAPTDVARGQALIGSIYDALVDSPLWPKTLFVVTYDEHGGFFDHVCPPGLPFADDAAAQPEVASGVTHLGVRVPAFVVSPWVPARPSHQTFDHTTIVKTILQRFLRHRMPDFGPRVRAALHLGVLLTNDAPRLDVPRVNPPPPERPPFRAPAGGDDFRDQMRSFGQPRFVHF